MVTSLLEGEGRIPSGIGFGVEGGLVLAGDGVAEGGVELAEVVAAAVEGIADTFLAFLQVATGLFALDGSAGFSLFGVIGSNVDAEATARGWGTVERARIVYGVDDDHFGLAVGAVFVAPVDAAGAGDAIEVGEFFGDAVEFCEADGNGIVG